MQQNDKAYLKTQLDGERIPVAPGDVIKLPIGCKHTVIADEPMKIIEVQLGEDITVEDKIIC